MKQLILNGIVSSAVQEELLSILSRDEQYDRIEKLAKILKSTIVSHSIAFLVIDGLDECDDKTQRDIIDFLKGLIESGACEIRILVTCRDESQTLGVISHWPSIFLSESAIGDDLRRFVSFSVRSSIERGDLNVSDTSLEREIVAVLAEKAHGMFVLRSNQQL